MRGDEGGRHGASQVGRVGYWAAALDNLSQERLAHGLGRLSAAVAVGHEEELELAHGEARGGVFALGRPARALGGELRTSIY